jgi:hypothetical protein
MAKAQSENAAVQDAQKPEVVGATVVEVPADVAVVGKKKTDKTGNLILDIAHEVEQMTKVKALNEADKLAENIEVNYFKMGGVLKLIADNSWFEGFATLDDFVVEKYGFQGRKARYLISIYDNLVTKQIPWEKVAHIGWTKLKDLAPILTPDNVDEWVAKAEKLTVVELQALLKAASGQGTETTATTTDEVVKMNFKFKPDQADVVQQAIAKAKGELHTEFDTVALENICAGFVGGLSTTATKPPTVEEFVNQVGFEPLLNKLADMFPQYDISVVPAEPKA